MAPPHANLNQSAPLVSQDLQPSTAAGFQQQGTVDWTRVMSGSVTFSVEVLSRLSKAGVEAFTIYAARAIFSNVKLGPNGELRLHEALDKLSAFPSFGKVLWLGFGVKHIIWSMQESTEGLNCLGICACLVEGYSTIVAAKIIRELFLLYDPPAELSPALRQWAALVETSAGLLASSEFGLVLHGLTKLCLRDGQRNLRSPGSPKEIAFVLKEVFEVSAGRIDRLSLSGGADCAWIAAVAHWLLDLRVEVRDQDGTTIYRPDGTRSKSSFDSQIIINYHQGHSSELLRVSGKHYVVPSGRLLFKYSEPEDTLSCGRVSWESCLVDTFGSPMMLLLGSQARCTGACLGSAARIFLASVRDGEGHTEFSRTRSRLDPPFPVSETSYGRGFCLLARRLLPELGLNPVLHQTMEATVNTGYLDAAQQFSRSFTSLRQLCSCTQCHGDIFNASFCLLTLVQTICTLVRVMSTVCMVQDLKVQPKRSGLESLYWNHNDVLPHLDPVSHGLLRSWPDFGSLTQAQMLFSGQHEKVLGRDNIVATSRGGLCFFLNTLAEITSDPQRACVVTVVPGHIEWSDFMYNMVRDEMPGGPPAFENAGYSAVSMTTVKEYDDLDMADSSTPGLNAELIIEEAFPESSSLSAVYRLSTEKFPSQHLLIRPSDIWHKLHDAFTAASCEGKTCDSLNGFQFILVKGDGLLHQTPNWQMTRLPITRVLCGMDVSVWAALSQDRLETTNSELSDIMVPVIHRLQGKQCVRCCIVNAENALVCLDQRDDCCVSIITSI